MCIIGVMIIARGHLTPFFPVLRSGGGEGQNLFVIYFDFLKMAVNHWVHFYWYPIIYSSLEAMQLAVALNNLYSGVLEAIEQN